MVEQIHFQMIHKLKVAKKAEFFFIPKTERMIKKIGLATNGYDAST